MIKLIDLKKSYGSRVLFENVNFEVVNQDFVIVTGKSGCGKTTLLNCIAMLCNFSSGDIEYNGKLYSSLNNFRRMKILKQDFGIVFQDFGLIEDMSVYQNLKYINKDKNVIEKLLEDFNLNISLHSKVSILSGGEKQRLSLVRVVLKNSKVILADEPTGNLDEENKYVVMNHLKRLNEEGKTIIVVTHDQDLISYGNKRITL